MGIIVSKGLIGVEGLHNSGRFVPLVNSPYLIVLSEPNGDEAQVPHK
jgi:hypothetical protein